MVARASAGDVQQVALRIVDLFEIGFVGWPYGSSSQCRVGMV
jgi:hypothetical protein